MKHIIEESDHLSCLALDLGGTKLLIGEIDENGNVCRSKRYASSIAENASQKIVIESVIESICDYEKTVGFVSKKIKTMGMGLVGRVDSEHGIWLEIEPSRAEPLYVAKILSERFNATCVIDNDVRCAVSAEEKLGWGNKSRNYIYINVGTGIAAGFVIDGRVLIGASYNAGEIGHHVIYRDSKVECSCGRKGCVEAIASGMGMDKRARDLKVLYHDTRLNIPENSRCSIKEIFELADQGDPLCELLSNDAVDALANTIMNMVWVSDPDTVVLGGGVVKDGWLLPRIKTKLSAGAMRFVKNGLVMTAINPEYVGLIGAGVKGLNYYKKMKGVDI